MVDFVEFLKKEFFQKMRNISFYFFCQTDG